MTEAKETLSHLSEDPKVASLSRERELARITHQIYMQGAREEGLEKGREEGLEKGRALGLIEAIESLCDAFSIEVTETHHASLQSMSLGQLREQLARIKRDRHW